MEGLLIRDWPSQLVGIVQQPERTLTIKSTMGITMSKLIKLAALAAFLSSSLATVSAVDARPREGGKDCRFWTRC
jgi:hypothetical protein